MVYINNSLHLARKYARIFVLGHYLFREAHSFPRASLSENCSLLGTDNVRGQISAHIFAPNGGYCLFIIHQIFSLARDWSKPVTGPNIPQLKLWNIREYSPVFKTDFKSLTLKSMSGWQNGLLSLQKKR